MTRANQLRVAAFFVVVVLLINQRAWAAMIVISHSDRIPFSTSYPVEARHQVRQALASKGCRFRGGLSGPSLAKSSLSFAGDSAALNGMLSNLGRCPSATVTVAQENIGDGCDWKVLYSTTGPTFHVLVNLDSAHVTLSEIQVPDR